MVAVMAFSENSVQENLLSDEEYVIYRAKISQKNDPSSSKAWAITAKTLFPRNFSVQLEAYTSQKAANNPKEAARHFSSLFFDFPNEAGLWHEVQGITEALQSGSANIASQFHRDLFAHLPLDIQHQLLLAMAERTDDTSEHCRLMLVLLSRFPAAIDIHGKKLVDSLLTAEKHSHYQSPVNCFRKLLVVDFLPILLSSKTVDIAQKQLYRLILKSIEFYLSWLASGSSTIQGLMENDAKPGESWKNLFKLMLAMGWKLGWELSTVFSIEGNREMMCQNLWAFYRSTPLGNEDSPNFRQLLYCTTVLLIESLFEYISRLEPSIFQGPVQTNAAKWEYPPLTLVRAFFPNTDTSVADPALLKRRKEEAPNCPPLLPLTVTRTCPPPMAGGLVSSFLTAVSCWELLHQTDELRGEFGRLCQHLRTDSWTWLPTFLIDAALHQGRLPEALAKMQTSSANVIVSPIHRQRLLLKSAGIFYSLGDLRKAVEPIVHMMANLPEGAGDPPPYPAVPPASASPMGQQHLHFLGYTRPELVQHCVNVLLTCLKDLALRNGNEDLALGHLVVLLQYDWPNHAGLFEEVLTKIRRQGHFSYQPFASYVVHVDVLEEFMFLAAEQSSETLLDIFPPSAAQLATQRRMTTRWGDKGAREDFRSAMKRQMGRSHENVTDLVVRFVVQERDLIMQAFS